MIRTAFLVASLLLASFADAHHSSAMFDKNRVEMAFIDTKDLEGKQPLPGWQGRYFNSENMTFGYYSVEAGSTIHEHSHPNEEVWHVIEGELEVTVGGETQIAGPGCVALVPPNTPHSVRAVTDGRSIVVDHPIRARISGVDVA